jgi:hypothetical protein
MIGYCAQAVCEYFFAVHDFRGHGIVSKRSVWRPAQRFFGNQELHNPQISMTVLAFHNKGVIGFGVRIGHSRC